MEFKHLSDQLNSALEHVTSPQGVGTLPDELIPEPAFSMLQYLVVRRDGKCGYGEIDKNHPGRQRQKERTIVKILMQNPVTYGDFTGYQKGLPDRVSVKALGNPDSDYDSDSVTTLKKYRDSLSQHLAAYRKDYKGSESPVNFIGRVTERDESETETGEEDPNPQAWKIKACHCDKRSRPTNVIFPEMTYHSRTLQDSCDCETFEVSYQMKSFELGQSIADIQTLGSCFDLEPDQEDSSTLGEKIVL
eukprot:GHVP01051828.1.p1 GENE.GHVP01051828.1~~GHVP01051828.1.p1  ORF type:complete len:247 (+),score=21.44 GHVP01051828.1:148-888(+)